MTTSPSKGKAKAAQKGESYTTVAKIREDLSTAFSFKSWKKKRDNDNDGTTAEAGIEIPSDSTDDEGDDDNERR